MSNHLIYKPCEGTRPPGLRVFVSLALATSFPLNLNGNISGGSSKICGPAKGLYSRLVFSCISLHLHAYTGFCTGSSILSFFFQLKCLLTFTPPLKRGREVALERRRRRGGGGLGAARPSQKTGRGAPFPSSIYNRPAAIYPLSTHTHTDFNNQD